MGQNEHEHSYLQALPLERFNIDTLQGYWEATPENPTVLDVVLRSQIETEILFHPDASKNTRQIFGSRRARSDEELMSRRLPSGDINSLVSRVFAPLLLDIGKDTEASRKIMQRRAKKVLDLCEDIFPYRPEVALGLCSEVFFNLAMNDGNTAANPSLRREDKGWQYMGKRCSWDSTVVSTGSPPIAAGVYRAQVKHGYKAQKYHPDITVVHVNPYDRYHVPPEAFVGFTRLLLPGTQASQVELDRLKGRIDRIHQTLRKHGPSRIEKITDRCLVTAA